MHAYLYLPINVTFSQRSISTYLNKATTNRPVEVVMLPTSDTYCKPVILGLRVVDKIN